ncbi:transcriptional regulator [Enterobacteriaceae bacterium 4M9]|nr:transcriptional regulator [Enterobacteriaceae bacterium 4M9]
MKYLIANKVIYNTELAELTEHGSEASQCKKLTDTANRILSLLMASHGQVLERDFLLKQVWESAGHASSSSSLNQYISILRKTLTSITDIEETIIVVPKVGFFFSSDIDVQPINADEIPEMTGKTKTAVKKHKPFPVAYTCAALVAVGLVVANLWLMAQPKNTARYSKLVELGKLEQCSLYTYESVTPDIHNRLMNILNTINPTLKDKCRTQSANVMLYVQPSVMFGGGGRVFHSYCLVDNKMNETTWCENLYAFNWKMK